MSRGSKYPRTGSFSASSTRAASSTVRHWMPARSKYGSAPIAPPYGSNPFVVTSATTALRHAGWRQEPPVSSQIEHSTRLAATDAADPELDPPVSRAVSYGLQEVPPHVLRAPAPYSRAVGFAAPPGSPLPALYSARFAFA